MDVLSQAKYEDMTEEQKMLIDTMGRIAHGLGACLWRLVCLHSQERQHCTLYP